MEQSELWSVQNKLSMSGIFNTPHRDPTQFPLTTSLWPVMIIAASYLLFVLKLGRQFMDNRKPFDLQNVLKVYNLLQIIYNGILFSAGFYYLSVERPYNFNCLTILPADHPMKNVDRILCYAYYINKFIDLLDTIFFVLRKNYKQISTLHLIHHLFMPISGHFLIRFHGYGGHIVVTGFLNVFVHILMYGYYYLSSQHPHMRRNLWWKQYITILQMLQFVIIFAHSVWTLMQPNCEVPQKVIYMVLFMSVAMFSMFSNFFIHSYILPKRKMVDDKLN